jgi:hypothetical protein
MAAIGQCLPNCDIFGLARAQCAQFAPTAPEICVLGKRHFVTFATDRPGGFTDAHLTDLFGLLPILALVSEIRVKNRLARTLLDTYVGSHAGELILAGATRRGSGMTVPAAIMICDLRDSPVSRTTGRATTSLIF